MSLKTTLTFTCDYAGCKASKTGPAVVSWIKEEAEINDAAMPKEAKYLVIFNQNGTLRTFCCQLHAAESFLPPGYEATQKKVIELPKTGVKPDTLPWLKRSEADERIVISRSEIDPVPQADGDWGPDQGPGGPQLDS